MNYIKSLLFIAFTAISLFSGATTWNEPWQDKVILNADYFVLAKIISDDEKTGVQIEITKTLGGKELKGEITLSNFYLLDLCSGSDDDGPTFHFSGSKECYFFIKKNRKGQYCIATPTTGFDYKIDGNVYATYRHSYHQALVPVEIYEKTMGAIFNHYHHESYDEKFISEYIQKYISLKPAGFEKSEMSTFFAQHVALECIYHLKLDGYYSQILPFLADTANSHNQISAARALISYNTAQCKKELLQVITDKSSSDFVKVICIWTLAEFKPVELKKELTKISKSASSEDNGFGGNLMDPRVCTFVPNVKEALTKLIDKL